TAARDEQHDPDRERQAGQQECDRQHHRHVSCRRAPERSIRVGIAPETARASRQYAEKSTVIERP
ncbi:hypothetical protein, partial [Burkholderia multivorans]|uniref:hypothetical protein n=1 Tax=Burkholderia multivorans TaxID=87883 RepID=UPI001EE68968